MHPEVILGAIAGGIIGCLISMGVQVIIHLIMMRRLK